MRSALLRNGNNTRTARAHGGLTALETETRHMQPHDKEAVRHKLASLAWLLDSSIPLPGLKFRIGIDALIGLIPALGDLVGVALSTYIVREAARLGAPKSVLARM